MSGDEDARRFPFGRVICGGPAADSQLLLSPDSNITGETSESQASDVMTKMSANRAKARFGELLDMARREPVTIEKHGRPVAVVLSTEEYKELQALKMSQLRAEIDIGLVALEQGDFVEVDAHGLQALVDDIKQAGRKNAPG